MHYSLFCVNCRRLKVESPTRSVPRKFVEDERRLRFTVNTSAISILILASNIIIAVLLSAFSPRTNGMYQTFDVERKAQIAV